MNRQSVNEVMSWLVLIALCAHIYTLDVVRDREDKLKTELATCQEKK